MDPNEALARMRAAIIEFRKMPSSSLAVEIADYAAALDQWLTSGGFPPEDWRLS